MFARLLFCTVLTLSLSSASAFASPADDVNALLKTVSDGMNKGDAKAAAAAWADDGDLINPAGVVGKGHAGVEKVLAGDIATILKGTTSKFTVETTRDLGNGIWLVDATHEAQNMTGPDGKKMTGKLHVAIVLTTSKDKKLQVAAARPYMYMPAPPAGKPAK